MGTPYHSLQLRFARKGASGAQGYEHRRQSNGSVVKDVFADNALLSAAKSELRNFIFEGGIPDGIGNTGSLFGLDCGFGHQCRNHAA